MRTAFVPALLAFAAGAAHALPAVQTLARFDLGFAKCEARYAHMKGHRDEAYLALWKIRPDDAQRAALAKQRASAAYRAERAQARKTMAPPGPEVDEKIAQQCQATWTELQRNTPPVTRGASGVRP